MHSYLHNTCAGNYTIHPICATDFNKHKKVTVLNLPRTVASMIYKHCLLQNLETSFETLVAKQLVFRKMNEPLLYLLLVFLLCKLVDSTVSCKYLGCKQLFLVCLEHLGDQMDSLLQLVNPPMVLTTHKYSQPELGTHNVSLHADP